MAKSKEKPKKKASAAAIFDLGLQMPTDDETAHIYNDVERELAVLARAYHAGSLPALYEALLVCQKVHHPAQRWMLRAMQRVLEALVRGELSYGPGPAGNPIARLQTDLKHYYRYDTVLDVRRAQKECHEARQWLENESGLTGTALTKRLANIGDPGRTWLDAYEEASVILQGTPACGAPDTIKRSFLKINKLFKSPDQAIRLKMLSLPTRRLFGLDF